MIISFNNFGTHWSSSSLGTESSECHRWALRAQNAKRTQKSPFQDWSQILHSISIKIEFKIKTTLFEINNRKNGIADFMATNWKKKTKQKQMLTSIVSIINVVFSWVCDSFVALEHTEWDEAKAHKIKTKSKQTHVEMQRRNAWASSTS